VIHGGFSYPTQHTIFPDPFFRINMDVIHKTKHGSDTGSYDTEGRWVPQKFEDFWSKYGKMYGGEVGVSKWDLYYALKAQRLVFDFFGWSGAIFECMFFLKRDKKPPSTPPPFLVVIELLTLNLIGVATYIALWPEDGILRKEEVRGIYDGSIWAELEKREQRKQQGKAKKIE